MKCVFVFVSVLAVAASQFECGIVNEGFPVFEAGPFDYSSPFIPSLACPNFDVNVSSCGPEPTLGPILPLDGIALPPVDGPVIQLPCPQLPAPTIIANKCTCTKTVLKPQLYQRIIQVQRNQRFLKQTFRPVLEKIPYCAKPSC